MKNINVTKEEALDLLVALMTAQSAQAEYQGISAKLVAKYKIDPKKYQYDVRQGAFLPIVRVKK